MKAQFIESGRMPPEKRRSGVVDSPLIKGDRRPSKKSMGFIERGGKIFEIRTCDPEPTPYCWVSSENADLFPEMKTDDAKRAEMKAAIDAARGPGVQPSSS